MIRTSIFIGGSRISDHDFTSISITHVVGGHHEFEIRLRQDAKKGILLEKAKSWIGQLVNIGFDNQDDDLIIISPVDDVFKGYVTSLGLSRRTGTGELVIQGYSPTVVMDDGPNTRSFTDKTIQEIVDDVVKPYNSKNLFPQAPIVEPKIYTDSIPYTVQYKESNFSFVNRIANRYGEWFYYDGLDFFYGKPEDGEAIDLDFGEKDLTYFDLSVRALPGNFEMKAYDYISHKVITEKALQKVKSNDLGKEALEIAKNTIFSETPSTSVQSYADKAELKNMVDRREQIALDETVILNGSSRNCKLKVGQKISIKDNAIGEDYGEYVIIKLVQDIGQGGNYTNSFEAIPIEVTTPPLNALPDSPFCETQLANVKKVDDSDSLGRVQVEFMWQEGSGEMSPWLRVASPYSGADKGFYIIPEVGDQVLVAFENNNPDKPYVLTGMYNGEAKPELFENKNYYKGFKSKAQNEWKFDDKNKSITISAPNSMTLTAGSKISIVTGGKADSEISIDTGDGTINVSAKIVNVKAAETVLIDSKKEVNVKGKNTIDIKSEDKLTVEGKNTVNVTAKKTKVEGKVSAEVSGKKVDVKGTGAVNVTGPMVKLN